MSSAAQTREVMRSIEIVVVASRFIVTNTSYLQTIGCANRCPRFPPNTLPSNRCHPERCLSSCEARRKQVKDRGITRHGPIKPAESRVPPHPQMHSSFVGSPSPGEGLSFLRTALLCSSVTYTLPHICHPECSLSSCEAGRKQAKDLWIPRHASTTFTS